MNSSTQKCQTFSSAVVTADSDNCARVGRKILKKGGSAVDAAIATLLAIGVANPQNMGLGGGFIMTCYNRKNEICEILSARESAPIASREGMFKGKPRKALLGGLATGVPGEMKGYWEAHKKYGKLPWAELFEDAIDMCQNGTVVQKNLAKCIQNAKASIRRCPAMKKVFYNQKTKDWYKEGEVFTQPVLARTMIDISVKGGDHFYTDPVFVKTLSKEIVEAGGIITPEDFKNYRCCWHEPVTKRYSNNMTLVTSPPPASGILLTFILALMDSYEFPKPEKIQDHVYIYHKMIEAFKFAFGERSKLGDEVSSRNEIEEEILSDRFLKDVISKIRDNTTENDNSYYGGLYQVPEDCGTSHVCVLAANGDAVSVTSSINTHFGSLVFSPSTGIVLNNHMDDFSSPSHFNYFNMPPSSINYIRPGKQPTSSMCPSIILDDENNVRMVVGGAGGTRILTSVSTTVFRSMWLNQPIEEALNSPRLHHQLFPMELFFEEEFDKELLKRFQSMGHILRSYARRFSGVSAIYKDKNGTIIGCCDSRRVGEVAGY